MNIAHIDRKNEEAKKFRSRTCKQEIKPDYDPTIHQQAQAGNQAKKEDIHLRNIIQAKHFINRKIFTISAKAH
jgi:hypothetical protein